MDLKQVKELVIRAGKELIDCGLIVRTWGNISCRIDDDTFAITPSGRAYDALTPDEIVVCRIEDASWEGNIKPSSEKGIHALVYRTYNDANFVIHTHQPQASAISATRLKSMPVSGLRALGSAVPVGEYGLPGTKTLRKGVGKALSAAAHAVIMSNHGALCFGSDYDETLLAAKQLEEASAAYIQEAYMTASCAKAYQESEAHEYYMSLMLQKPAKLPGQPIAYGSSRRTDGGFVVEVDGEKAYSFTDERLPAEAAVHCEIYKQRSDINYIAQDTTHGLLAASLCSAPLCPMLDDFAQIVGRTARCAKSADPSDVVRAMRGRLGVLVPGGGALCCAATQSDAHAVQLVMQKNNLAQMAAKLTGEVKPIGLIDCVLMHFVYTYSYAKKAKQATVTK